jgi:uncharacterized protein
MDRNEAFLLLNRNLNNKNLIKHCLATEAVMIALYWHFNPEGNKEEENKWALTGLLHDIDYEMANDQPENHGLIFFEKYPGLIPADIEIAIKAHNPQTGIEAKSLMERSILCCDQLTGLIVSASLIHPDKKLNSINTEFVLNRYKQPAFSKAVNRQTIILCEKLLDIPLREFIDINLKAMQNISSRLDL